MRVIIRYLPWVVIILCLAMLGRFAGQFYKNHSLISEKEAGFKLSPELISNAGHEFNNLISHSKDEIIDYLNKGSKSESQLKEPLFHAITLFHCTDLDLDNCDNYRFHKMKKVYFFYVEQKSQDIDPSKAKYDLDILQRRFNRLFHVLAIMDLPNYRPDFYLVEDKERANLLINILTPPKNEIFLNEELFDCKVNKVTKSNILVKANVNLYRSQTKTGGSFTTCESDLMLSFYDMLATTVSYTDKKKDVEIYLGLVGEYYRWLGLNNNHPQNRIGLKQSIEAYADFIYSNFSSSNSKSERNSK